MLLKEIKVSEPCSRRARRPNLQMGAMTNPQPQVTEHACQILTPVRDVFAALAQELERARSLGLRVEGAICAMAVRSAINGGVVGEFQHLDAVL